MNYFHFFGCQQRPKSKAYYDLRAGFHGNEKLTISGKYPGTGRVKTRFADKNGDPAVT